MRNILLLAISLAIAFWIYKAFVPAPSAKPASNSAHHEPWADSLKQPLDRTKAVLEQVKKRRDDDAKQF